MPGGCLLLALLADVFGTVFVPRGGPGIITRRFYRRTWSLWRRASRSRPQRERAVLALGGPVLVSATIALWALELVLAFALLYLPYADRFHFPAPGSGSRVLASLYVSAYSATTVGVGDIYPTDALPRLLTTVEAALGFALFTVAITYLLSVYGAIQRATALSLEIARFVGRSGDGAPFGVLCRLGVAGAEEEIVGWLAHTTSALAETSQAAEQYPLVEYFHVPDDDRALPLALGDLLALLTVCRSVLDPTEHPRLTTGPTVRWAYRTAAAFATSRAGSIGLDGDRVPDDDDDPLRCHEVRRRMIAAGIGVRAADEASASCAALRQEWHGAYETLVEHFGYGTRSTR